MSQIIQGVIGFTSLKDYFDRTIFKSVLQKSEVISVVPDDNSSVTPQSACSTQAPIQDLPPLEVEEPIEPLRVHVIIKPKKQDWNKWAKTNNLKDYQLFRVRYMGNTCKVTGFWHDGRYVLTSDRVAPIPPGREAEASRNGWGVPIECDCPTRVVSLVKMSYGAPINNGRGPSARPYELEMQLSYNRWIPVYKS
jgi:hypothetical protein